MVRCNRCGNENPSEAFVCAFCAAKLKTESIERIKYFERPEKRWKRPQGTLTRFKQVFTNPSELFWDLRYDEKHRGGGYVILIDAALFGLLGLVLASKIVYSVTFWQQGLTSLSIFIAFFALGLVYHLMLFGFLSLLFRMVAVRVGGKKQSHSFEAMLYAFFPSIVGNGVSLLILLIALPAVPFAQNDLFAALTPLFQSPAWVFVDIINLVIYAGWVPILAALGIRSLHEISTTRSITGCYIVGILVALLLIITRGTFFPSAVAP
ncbi:MAG TPA: Yip1 family protein [Candidatus Lokiarchaeia archaeon]|nr:Yip1 family protein [Candidatus Lokiarchaeia archaeon]